MKNFYFGRLNRGNGDDAFHFVSILFDFSASFPGKVITAAYVPVTNYHNLFMDAMTSTSLLQGR